MLFPAGDFGETFCIRAFRSKGGFGRGIQREISEKMALFMALSALKGNMFIIYSLNPFKVVMEEAYQVSEGFGEMHVDTDRRI